MSTKQKLVENSYSSISNVYPMYRDDIDKSIKRWLDGKRITDNAEDLWRVHDKIYDLSKFIKLHPGGAEWLEMTIGCDITEQFETHHIDTEKTEKILQKYYVRDAAKPRIYQFTYNEDGFYRTLKRKVAEKMKEIDKRPILYSKIISDLVLGLVFATSIIAVKLHNFYLAILAGLFLGCMTGISHNFFHQKDNWRMYTFNLSLLNYRDWRVSHAMSHHLYPNTYFDLEISKFEPFQTWIPTQKTKLEKTVAIISTPFIYLFSKKTEYMKMFLGYFFKYNDFNFDHLIPFTLPIAMFLVEMNDVILVLIFWAIILTTSNLLFSSFGLNVGHHHPDVTHEGDEIDSSRDFGIFQLNCIIDRSDTKSNLFLTLISFGNHTLHHLFPTLDHAILPQLHDTLIETCQEFQTELREYSWWPLIVGQFQQLLRTEPRTLKEMGRERDKCLSIKIESCSSEIAAITEVTSL